MKIFSLLFLLIPAQVFAHSSGLDNQGGHFNRQTNVYEGHKEPCFSIHKQTEEAYKQADPETYSRIYNRKDWPHWIDEDGMGSGGSRSRLNMDYVIAVMNVWP